MLLKQNLENFIALIYMFSKTRHMVEKKSNLFKKLEQAQQIQLKKGEGRKNKDKQLKNILSKYITIKTRNPWQITMIKKDISDVPKKLKRE